jgi:uncharacterized metal-binding protein YceD (DUF177 family)
MKIEFRKVPLQESEFKITNDSVEFSGTFSKITSKLAKIESNVTGDCEVDCCKCGQPFTVKLDEKLDLLVSDGIYSSENKDEEDVVIIEVEDHIVDFDEILNSELESFKSEYFVCAKCKDSDFVEIEY